MKTSNLFKYFLLNSTKNKVNFISVFAAFLLIFNLIKKNKEHLLTLPLKFPNYATLNVLLTYYIMFKF